MLINPEQKKKKKKRINDEKKKIYFNSGRSVWLQV